MTFTSDLYDFQYTVFISLVMFKLKAIYYILNINKRNKQVT